jgi:hypothetical protein
MYRENMNLRLLFDARMLWMFHNNGRMIGNSAERSLYFQHQFFNTFEGEAVSPTMLLGS